MTLDVDVLRRTASRSVPLRLLLQATRPKQWVKNLLVFAAPLAAGAVTHRRVIPGELLALLAFTLASAGGYLLNDVCDAKHDRAHPDKRHRPLASGALGPVTAAVAGSTLTLGASLTALAADREELATVVAVYSAVTVVYGAWLKQVPVVELGLLSTGFVLRPVAGAVATQVPPSLWFLAVCCLAALVIAAGKRQVELRRLGVLAPRHRPVLAAYSERGLRLFRASALTLMFAAYAGWALTRPTDWLRILALASLAPVAVAMLRLQVLNDAGYGDAPETLLLRDRVLQVAVVIWTLVFVLGLGRV